jgi:solute:Na+ symporter, SSS family
MGNPPINNFIVGYLLIIILIGIWFSRKQKTINDFFLGNKKLPWFAICLSIVASETSILTIVVIPGLAYLTNLNFLQVAIGFLIGRIIISFFLLPSYYYGAPVTAYEFLDWQYGAPVRNFSALVFLVSRFLFDGVRLIGATTLIIGLTGWNYSLALIIIVGTVLIYTLLGGFRATIWAQVIQIALIWLGMATLIIFALKIIPVNIAEIISFAKESHKLKLFNWELGLNLHNFFRDSSSLIGSLVGGIFLSLGSHGVDQVVVQRLLAGKSLRDSQKALITSGVIIFIQSAFLLMLGVLLFSLYRGRPISIEPDLVKTTDQLLPGFIAHILEFQYRGLVIVALLAAAMTTLGGAINSMACSTLINLIKPYRHRHNDYPDDLKWARMLTLFWGLLLIFFAFIFQNRQQPMFKFGLAIGTITYGGLLGAFVLARYFKYFSGTVVLYSMWATTYFMTWFFGLKGISQFIILGINGIAFLFWFFSTQERKEMIAVTILFIICSSIIRNAEPITITWYWQILIGCLLTILLGIILNRFIKPKPTVNYFS